MSFRKLGVVNYKKQNFDVADDKDFVEFLCDMDELYLKKKDEDWIANILDEKDANKRDSLIKEYINILGLHENASRRAVANHILDLAIEMLYNNNENIHSVTSQKLNDEKDKRKQSQINENPFTGVDSNTPEFVDLVNQLCKCLSIAPHPDPFVRLKAACVFIQENLSVETIDERNAEKKENPNMKSFQLDSIPLGFPQQKDKALNFVARILRILNVNALRSTQVLINETLVAIQNLTIDQTKQPNMKQVQYGR